LRHQRILRALFTAGSLGVVTAWAPAEVDAQGRWTFTPSLSLAERFDDNVFLTESNRKSDFITEFVPAFTLTHERATLSLSAGYSITGEIYADNSQLDNLGDNQNGFLSAIFQVSPRLTLKLATYYARTRESETFLGPPAVPQNVTVTTVPAVVSEPEVVSQFTLTASGTYQFDAATAGTAAYSLANVDGDDNSHTVSLGASRQLTALDEGAVTGSASVFDTGETTSDGDGITTSFALLVGWRRRWTPNLDTNVELGPQLTDDQWGVAATLGLKYQIQRQLSVVVTFIQAPSLVVGEEGPKQVSRLLGTVQYQASRALALTAFGSIGRTAPIDDLGSSDATTTYAVGASASYQLTRYLSAYLRYRYTLEDEAEGGEIRNNEVTLGLTLFYPVVF
jgi:hypothetical protein